MLGIGQKAIVMPAYPHMMTEDAEVWTKFLQGYDRVINQVWYDLHVGSIPLAVDPADEMAVKIALGIMRKRIDVICDTPDGFWVCEIKPYGSYVAVGQVLLYTELFIAEYEPDVPVWPVVICRKVDTDILGLFEREGVISIEA